MDTALILSPGILNAVKRSGSVIYLLEYTVKKLDECELQSFLFAKWRVCFPQKIVTLNAIYHPTCSKKHPIRNATFLNEFSDTDLAVENNKDSIILGDLNINLNDEQSYDAETLNEIINSLG